MENRETLEKRRTRLALAVEEGQPGAEEDLEKVEEEISRLTRNEERSALAAKARAQRDKEKQAEERAKAIEAMKDMLVKFDQKFERDLDRLLSQRRPKADDVRAVYDLGKQAYSLSHDLLDLTNQREFKRPWNIRARLGEDLAMMIHEMFVPSFRKPPVGRPWADLYEVVKEAI